MAIILNMLRRPRLSTVQHAEILAEVKPALEKLAADTVKELQKDISEWETQPEFRSEVKITKKQWKFAIKVDRRSKAGKIYTWVDRGTGERGDDPSGRAYDIFPKYADVLSFDVPYVPKTEPYAVPGVPVIDYGAVNPGPEAHLALPMVHAPGIRPRHFTKYRVAILKDRSNNKGFKRTLDNAMKRGVRRIGKRGGK